MGVTWLFINLLVVFVRSLKHYIEIWFPLCLSETYDHNRHLISLSRRVSFEIFRTRDVHIVSLLDI